MIIHTNTRWKPKNKAQRKKLYSHKTGIKIVGSGKEYKPTTNHLYDSDPTRSIKSLESSLSATTVKPVARYTDPEMKERERAARAEIEAKKMRVAPAYSKGAYQYITDGTDPRELGCKNV